MKKTCLLLVLLCLTALMQDSIAQIFHEDFLTAQKYKVTMGAEGNDGKRDYFQRVTNDSIALNYSGTDSIFFAGQDLDDGGWNGSESPSQLTWSGIDIKGMVKLRFEGQFAEVIEDGGEIDRTDALLVQYKVDDKDWESLMLFANTGETYNTLFYEDTDFDGIGDGTCISSAEGTMVTMSKSFYVWGDSLALSFTASVNSDKEDFAIDNFKLFEETVTGTNNTNVQNAHIRVVGSTILIQEQGVEQVRIYSLNGKVVMNKNYSREPLNVSHLKGGHYIVVITSDDGSVFTQKIYLK